MFTSKVGHLSYPHPRLHLCNEGALVLGVIQVFEDADRRAPLHEEVQVSDWRSHLDNVFPWLLALDPLVLEEQLSKHEGVEFSKVLLVKLLISL